MGQMINTAEGRDGMDEAKVDGDDDAGGYEETGVLGDHLAASMDGVPARAAAATSAPNGKSTNTDTSNINNPEGATGYSMVQDYYFTTDDLDMLPEGSKERSWLQRQLGYNEIAGKFARSKALVSEQSAMWLFRKQSTPTQVSASPIRKQSTHPTSLAPTSPTVPPPPPTSASAHVQPDTATLAVDEPWQVSLSANSSMLLDLHRLYTRYKAQEDVGERATACLQQLASFETYLEYVNVHGLESAISMISKNFNIHSAKKQEMQYKPQPATGAYETKSASGFLASMCQFDMYMSSLPKEEREQHGANLWKAFKEGIAGLTGRSRNELVADTYIRLAGQVTPPPIPPSPSLPLSFALSHTRTHTHTQHTHAHCPHHPHHSHHPHHLTTLTILTTLTPLTNLTTLTTSHTTWQASSTENVGGRQTSPRRSATLRGGEAGRSSSFFRST
jgi:hypothetical protein